MPRTQDTTPRTRSPAGSPLCRLVATIPTQSPGAVMVVRLVGEVDVSNGTTVGDQLAELLASRPTSDVVLDLSGVPFMDLSGMRVLLEVRRVTTLGRRQLWLRGVRPGVELILRVTGHQNLLAEVAPPTGSLPRAR